MPKLATLIKILRDGTKRSGLLKESDGGALITLRDHYTRLDLFWSKRYPKQDRQFVDAGVAEAAISADRDSTLGILDTITREFITFWMPELEVFIEEDYEETDKDIYRSVVVQIEKSIIDIANRLDCARDTPAALLQKALIKLAISYLQNLFEWCNTLLDDNDRALYNPEKYLSDVNRPKFENERGNRAVEESISEARLLNSAIAWEVSDHQEAAPTVPIPIIKSPVKRGFSEAFDDGPDPADNGAAWDMQQTTKRQKFEVKISKVIDVSDSEDAEDGQFTTTSQPRRILKPVSRSNRSNKNNKIISKSETRNSINVDAQMELEVPGALKTNDENCILM